MAGIGQLYVQNERRNEARVIDLAHFAPGNSSLADIKLRLRQADRRAFPEPVQPRGCNGAEGTGDERERRSQPAQGTDQRACESSPADARVQSRGKIRLHDGGLHASRLLPPPSAVNRAFSILKKARKS